MKLTRGQAEQLVAEEGLSLPDGWEAIARRGERIGHVIGLPAELVATVEESTPWAHGWRPPVAPEVLR